MRRIIELGLIAALTVAACDTAAPPASAPAGGSGADMDAPQESAGATSRNDDAATSPSRPATHRVVFVGTSLTAGYGVGADVAYPALLQQRIDSAGIPFRVVNAGISGETSAGGLRRMDWVLQDPVDVFVLELGANDGLRGVAPDEMRRNLDAILAQVRERYPDAGILMLGMEAPPNLGDAYTTRFREVFADLAEKHDAALMPFLLEGVAGDPALNIEDRIHPNAEGHRRIAERVWPRLQPLLRDRAARPPAG